MVVMNHGRIEQIGSPDAVYASPALPCVHRFLGTVNVFQQTCSESSSALSGSMRCDGNYSRH